MKAYKKLQSRYHEKVKAKYRAKIKCFVISFIIIFVVLCFVGLVIGLSLGLKPDDQCTGAHQDFCQGSCRNIKTDNNYCGNCNTRCKFDASCTNGFCTFCTKNCSDDNNMCTISPCNHTTGCAIFDCNTDSDACTINPCNGTANNGTGSCSVLDCSNDGDFCSIPPFTSATGCAVINCDALGDPCKTNPCSNGACANPCPQLLLNPPAINYTATINFTGGAAVAVVPSTLTLASVPDILSVVVTYSLSIGGDNLAVTTSGSVTSTFSSTSQNLTLTATGNVLASTFQTILRTLTYSATTNPSHIYKQTLTFFVVNNKPLGLPSPVTAFLTLDT